MLSRSRLPRGIVTGAEARINVKVGEIESLLRTKRNHGKTPVQYWKDFVEAEFFNVAQRIRKEVESREETTKEAEDTSAQEQEEQQIRTFSASLLPLLRSDLLADIQDTFLKTIEEAVVSASDYIDSYSVQVYKLVLLLKKSSFFKLDNDEIILQHNVGVSIQDIVPESFCCQSDINHFSPPIDRSCLTDGTLKKEFNSLFNSSHLQVIHASYFGTQGVTEGTLKKHPFQTALRQVLNEDGRRNESTDPVVMKLALNRYISNFKNMWSQKIRSRKTLNRVLIVLLRIHLAPKRERRKIEELTKKKSEKAKNTDKAPTKIKLANKSYKKKIIQKREEKA